ncbi:FliM/FliN family flagellar motor switch protein [Desulfurobacterium atlanticum]|uniref:Flagellar motor switch protein FliN n=1 Tax=Desulfurobacterium atlanticum TaxID=240169 RepID=A0A238YZV8_9BACT|nr:FliM/FliN family flagellar motor switch protein [Desulfurobacterium atlanticum]SNR76552.1 flagellar motor switch protein FliN/FliY [Desulfurobacterium atlanticum]
MLKLDDLKDITLTLSLEVGKTVKPFGYLLKLKEGDVLPLDKNLEEFLSIKINGQQFAVGELIVVNDKFGVKVIDLE